MFLIAKNLSALPGISHGFFTRKGGVSKGIYASLNCGLGSGDDKTNVIENRKRVAKALGGDPDTFCTLYQTHSADVITVEQCWRHSKLPKADAMVTNKPGIALGILTADCVPVLFADSTARVIGAAHSGWRGMLAGILGQTVCAMQRLGAAPDSITAAIGPGIAQPSFEVGPELREAFMAKEPDSAKYFIPAQKRGHYLFDLKALILCILGKAGIRDVNLLENDTYLEEDAFFSFRRTTHKGEADYGRQISAIMLTR